MERKIDEIEKKSRIQFLKIEEIDEAKLLFERRLLGPFYGFSLGPQNTRQGLHTPQETNFIPPCANVLIRREEIQESRSIKQLHDNFYYWVLDIDTKKDRLATITTNSSSECDENQEFQELLRTLPKENGNWGMSKPIIYTTIQACHTDVLLATQPKSGTTWLKALAFSMARCKRYALPTHPLLTNNPHKFVPFNEFNLEKHHQDLADCLSSSLPPFSPRVLSTHLPYESLPESIMTSSCSIVHLCRNPKDTFISTWHFINTLRYEDMNILVGLLYSKKAMIHFVEESRFMVHFGSIYDGVLKSKFGEAGESIIFKV
ncbi:hypothetical protein Sjap_013902 [Stephania japonica]|uniref:Sulfotransferase n=1 Tax=Stephania japonica TaxID=461633 RepID=A0AAP0P0F4_9MAGN